MLLRRDGHTQLVYKHAISTIMPGAPIQLFDPSKVAAAQEQNEADSSQSQEAAVGQRARALKPELASV